MIFRKYNFIFLILTIIMVMMRRGVQGDAAIQCPDIKLKFPFELSQFLGVWYQISRFSKPAPTPSTVAQHLTQRPILSECIRISFTLKDDGKLRVERSGLDKQGKLVTQVGEGAQGQAEHARLYFKYPGEYEEDLGVVEADYEDHALLYGCHLSSTGHVSQDAWILGRDPELDSDTLEILKSHLSSRRVDIGQFVHTRQDEKCKQQNPDNETIISQLYQDLGV